MKKLFAILLSIITGIGGHFINRRWDRAILFLMLALTWAIGTIAYSFLSIIWYPETPYKLDYNFTILLSGIGALWLLSILITIYDAINVKEEVLHRWTISGGISATLSTLLSASLLFYCFTLGYAQYTRDYSDYTAPIESKVTFGASNYFTEYIYFGRIEQIDNLPSPPSGGAYISGRFMYKDKPAVGVTLTVLLNGKYESEVVETDDNGEFHVRVPEGEWYISLLKTQSWKNKPVGKNQFIVVTGNEPLLEGNGSYHSQSWSNRGKGKRIMATEQANSDSFTLTIRDNMALYWPNEESQSERIDVEDAVISWEQFEGATQYLVGISHIEEKNGGWSSWVISTRRTNQKTKIPLTQFRTIPTKKTDLEYAVTVHAFDKEGKYLSESLRFGDNRRFKLPEGIEIVNDVSASIKNKSFAFNDTELQELSENSDRLDAIDILIADNLLDEAESLIGKIQGKSEDGRLDAVKGYLAAKRGECEIANQLFDEALKQGGQSCIPARYREACK